MAKNISLLGADYPDVPAVDLPKTGGGTARFVDADDVNNVENALAIVIDGDTAPKAISKGQYLFIKNHSTLATGGYHATAAISSGGSVSGSNVTADADGIANTINTDIVKLNGVLTVSEITNGYRFLFSSPADSRNSIQFEVLNAGGNNGKMYVIAKYNGNTVYNKNFTGA